MKTLKKYFQLMTYGLQFKTMVIFTVVFFALGIVFELTGIYEDSFVEMSGLYMGLAGLYVYQLLLTPVIAKIIQASPAKKELLTKAPVLASTLLTCVTYSVFVALRIFYTIGQRYAKMPDEFIGMRYIGILETALLIAIILCFTAVMYKYYVVSLVLLVVLLVPLMLLRAFKGVVSMELSFYHTLTETFGATGGHAVIVLAGYAVILLGGLGCYLLNCLFYRKEISELTYRSALKQASK